jgi:hypothetical protein
VAKNADIAKQVDAFDDIQSKTPRKLAQHPLMADLVARQPVLSVEFRPASPTLATLRKLVEIRLKEFKE